jgi:hypothetical protein
VLPDELKETPLKLLLADQVRLPCEFEVSITVTVQDQILPVLSGVQGLPLKSDKPVGLTVKVGGGGTVGDGGGAEQPQDTLTVFAGPVKVKVALAGQAISGMVIVT